MSETDSPMPHLGAELERVRANTPLVHNITNFVAMQTVANVQLAIGASPAMAHALEEASELAALASALTVNIGTLETAWVTAMAEAATTANSLGTPWVFDPVAVGASRFRQTAARRLVAIGPTVIRGNASEIIALHAAVCRRPLTAGDQRGRGVDATAATGQAVDAARQLAHTTGAVVAVTGAHDLVCSHDRIATVANGDALMPRVTALGCALTGVVGAFLGAGAAAFDGTLAALAYYGLAGERAATRAQGPGSFAVAFLDELTAIDGPRLDRHARIETQVPEA